jgi:hypothetical protein
MTTLPAQSNSSNPGKQPIIPWLWFWLVVYLINVPTLISGVKNDYLRNIFKNPLRLLEDPLQVGPTIWMDLMELSALTVVFLGVITITFPRIRALLLEKSNHLERLSSTSSTPSVQEIRAYILDYLPKAQIRINLKRFDQFAITYPLGYRTYAIAVFGGLVLLWKKDRQAAQAVLLHEIAHCKQGDALIVGAGSLLQWSINYSPLLLFPILLIQGYDIFNSWYRAGGLRMETLMNNSPVGQNLREVLSNYLFDDLRILLLEIMYTAWIIVLPVAGIWISELGADRDVAGNLLASSDISRALQNLRNKKKLYRLLASLSHPPATWRTWCVKHHENPLAWIIPVLAFPLAYVLRIIFYLITAANAAWISGLDWVSITQLIKEIFRSCLNTYVPLWIAMSGVVLLWPFIASLFDWFFNRQRQPVNWSKYHQNLICAGVIGCLALASAYLSNSIFTSPQPFEPKAEFTPGQHFQIGDVIHATGLDITVLGWKEVSTDNTVFASQPSNKYVAVELTVTNTGEAAKSTASLSQMKLQDAQGQEYELSVNVNLILNAETPDGRIAPSETLRGVVGYEIPHESSDLAFIFIDNVLDESKRFLVDLGSKPVAVTAPVSDSSDAFDARQLQEPVHIGDIILSDNQVEALSPSKTFQLGGVVLTLNQVDALSPSKAFQPDSGTGYLAVGLSLENKGSQTVIFPSITYMEIKDENGVVYKVDFHATVLAGEQTTNFTVNAGETVYHRLGYQVPLAAQKLFFAFSFDRDKVFVQLPVPSWPEYTVAPTPSTPSEEVDVTTYQVPEEWIKSRQESGLPALIGNTTEDWLLLGEECASGVQESCRMDEVFLDVAIPMPTSQATP